MDKITETVTIAGKEKQITRYKWVPGQPVEKGKLYYYDMRINITPEHISTKKDGTPIDDPYYKLHKRVKGAGNFASGTYLATDPSDGGQITLRIDMRKKSAKKAKQDTPCDEITSL